MLQGDLDPAAVRAPGTWAPGYARVLTACLACHYWYRTQVPAMVPVVLLFEPCSQSSERVICDNMQVCPMSFRAPQPRGSVPAAREVEYTAHCRRRQPPPQCRCPSLSRRCHRQPAQMMLPPLLLDHTAHISSQPTSRPHCRRRQSLPLPLSVSPPPSTASTDAAAAAPPQPHPHK